MKKLSETQRKIPKQDRSKAIVDAIFEATVRILPKVGSMQITTKKIADFAGVSVGSLYQYFPNKESVLSHIMDVVSRAKNDEIQKKFDEISQETLEKSVEIIVDLGLNLFLSEPQKMREIYRYAPELGKLPHLLHLRNVVVDRLAHEIERHRPGLTAREYQTIGFVAVNSLMGVVHTVLYDEERDFTVPELSQELKTMFKGYFSGRLTP